MFKTAIGVLFLVLFAVTVGAQESENIDENHRGTRLAIQSFGWKCNKIKKFEAGLVNSGYSGYAWKVTCELNRTYYVRVTHTGSGYYESTFCKKSTCKEFK